MEIVQTKLTRRVLAATSRVTERVVGVTADTPDGRWHFSYHGAGHLVFPAYDGVYITRCGRGVRPWFYLRPCVFTDTLRRACGPRASIADMLDAAVAVVTNVELCTRLLLDTDVTDSGAVAATTNILRVCADPAAEIHGLTTACGAG